MGISSHIRCTWWGFVAEVCALWVVLSSYCIIVTFLLENFWKKPTVKESLDIIPFLKIWYTSTRMDLGKAAQQILLYFLLCTFIYSAWKIKKLPLAIVMDLSKAFNTMNHTILLCKLNSYVIKGPTYRWTQTYLINRLQVTENDPITSESRKTEWGIPRGSILGPLIFQRYINDNTQPTLAPKAMI